MFVLQHNYLAQVTSNIWGTKFKIVGLAAFLPTNLGAGKSKLDFFACQFLSNKQETYTMRFFFASDQKASLTKHLFSVDSGN